MHEHNECKHELKYCRACNVVYCEKCGSQWYSYKYTVTYNPYYTYSNGGTVLSWTPCTHRGTNA